MWLTFLVSLSLLIGFLSWPWMSRMQPRVRRGVCIAASTVLAVSAMICSKPLLRALPGEFHVVVFVGVAALVTYLLMHSIERQIVRSQSAHQLAWLRIVVTGTLLFMVAKDDVLTTLLIPESMMRPPARLIADLISWFDRRDTTHLRFLQFACYASLMAGMLGLFGTTALVIAAIAYTLHYQVLIAYTHYYHSGLTPLHMLYVMMFLPVNDAWSIDSWWRRRRKVHVHRSAREYGFATYAVMIAYLLPYFAAGLCKWFASPYWGVAASIKRIMVRDSMQIVEYDMNLAAWAIDIGVPDWLFTVMGTAAMFAETLPVLVLVHDRWWTRVIAAAMIAYVHGGIFLGQKFVFWDLAFLPLVFVSAEHIRSRLSARTRVDTIGAAVAEETHRFPHRRQLAYAILCGILVSNGLGSWWFRFERFPIQTTWGMYSKVSRAPRVGYKRLYAVRASGVRERTNLEEYIEIYNHNRYADTFAHLKTKHGQKQLTALYQSIADHYNPTLSDADRLVAFEIEAWEWNIVRDPHNQNHGKLTKRHRFDVK